MENILHFSIFHSRIFLNVIFTFLDDHRELILFVKKSREILANQEGNDRCHVCTPLIGLSQLISINE
jgi:hypothetical protein